MGNRLYIKDEADQNAITYTYNAKDELITENITDGNTITYTYNDNGSLIKKDDGTTVTDYSYNLLNRLASVDDGTTSVAYKYGPDGIRTEKKVGSSEPITYLIDPYNHTGYSQVLKEVQTGTDPVIYIIGSDVYAQAVGSANPVYLLYDGHGSARNLTSSTGAILESYDYDAYGNRIDSSTQQTDYLYSGEQYDSHLGKYYLRARDYNSKTGRFDTKDISSGRNEEPSSLHKYNYVAGNPTNLTDPSGLDWVFANMGKAVHREVAQMYRIEHGGNKIIANYFHIPGTGGSLKPDIMDFTLKEIAEIKPLNVRQMAIGSAKLFGYITTANLIEVEGGGWRPSSWNVGFRAITLPEYPGWTIVTTGNYCGLLPYVRYKMSREQIERALKYGTAGALAYKLKEIAARMKNKGNTGLEELEGLAYEIQRTMDIIIVHGAAQVSVRNVTMAATAGMTTYIGMRMALTPMTVRYGF